MAILILVANVVTVFIISNAYSISVSRFYDSNYMRYYYKKPWTRIGAYQIGVLFGMMYYEWKNRDRDDKEQKFVGVLVFYKVKHSKVVRYLLFFMGIAIFLF